MIDPGDPVSVPARARPMIACVTIHTSHAFSGNPIAAQHRLRYREVIAKEHWKRVYTQDGDMEFDRYDNLGTEYLICRDTADAALGVVRSTPTTLPCMLSGRFKFLLNQRLPSGPAIREASRIVVDRTALTKEQRKPVVDRLLMALLERGLQLRLEAYVGFMLKQVWASTFLRVGWEPEWLGPEMLLRDGSGIARAGRLPVSAALRTELATSTGLHDTVLSFGDKNAGL